MISKTLELLSFLDRLRLLFSLSSVFGLMEYISVISCRNPINLYIPENLIKFSKSLFNFYLVILNVNKEHERLVLRPLFSLSGVPSRTCCV